MPKSTNTRLEDYQRWGRDQLVKHLNRGRKPGDKKFLGNDVIKLALAYLWFDKNELNAAAFRAAGAEGDAKMQASYKRSTRR